MKIRVCLNYNHSELGAGVQLVRNVDIVCAHCMHVYIQDNAKTGRMKTSAGTTKGEKLKSKVCFSIPTCIWILLVSVMYLCIYF